MSSPSIATTSTRPSWIPSLIWKEFRQIVPLMTTVLIGGFGLLLLLLFFSALSAKRSLQFDRGFWFLFLSMPMMYATGVGILLVGNEKESRSLQWMRSLPICSKQIAWTKLVVALLTLALVWLIALTAWCVFATALGGDPLAMGFLAESYSYQSAWMLPTYLLTSLFLSLAGLAFAWRFESQFLALVLLVPAALALWLPAYGLAYGLESYLSRPSLELQRWIDVGPYLLSLSIGCIGFLVYGWRASQRELTALEPPIRAPGTVSWIPSGSWLRTDGSASERRSSEAWMLWPRVSPMTGMLWQMVRQNGIWWIAYAALGTVLLLLCSRSSLLQSNGVFSDSLLLYLFIPMAILSGWLGVLAYHSDSTRQRVRFYADRGVSPTLYWCTRHWIPVLLMLGLCLVRYITNFGISGTPLDLVDAFGFLAILLASYSVGQWVSQFIKSPTLAAITAPMALAAMFAYCIFAIVGMESPWWLLSATFAVLFLATVWMMRHWMERRIDWKYYLKHGGFLFVALFVPMLPGLWKIWTIPGISKELRETLSGLATSTPLLNANAISGSLANARGNAIVDARRLETPGDYYDHFASVDGTIDKIQSRLESNEKLRARYPQELIDRFGSTTLWRSSQDPESLLRTYIAELARLRSEIRIDSQSATDPADNQSKSALENYRKILSSVPDLVRNLRANHHLKDTDLAERIEIIALGHCLDPSASKRLGQAVFEPLTELLTDDRSRDESRRIALANAWREKFASSMGTGISFYSDEPHQAYSGSIPSGVQLLYSSDQFVVDLWKLLDASPGSPESFSQRQRILTKSLFDHGGPIDLIDGTIHLGFPGNMPAKAWRGNWEHLTKQLRTEAKKSNE